MFEDCPGQCWFRSLENLSPFSLSKNQTEQHQYQWESLGPSEKVCHHADDPVCSLMDHTDYTGQQEMYQPVPHQQLKTMHAKGNTVISLM